MDQKENGIPTCFYRVKPVSSNLTWSAYYIYTMSLKTSPFDLKRALAGDTLVMDGNVLKNKLVESHDLSNYPYYVFDNEKIRWWFNKNGQSNNTYGANLFMLDTEQTLLERLATAAILTKTKEEYLELRGMFRAAGYDTSQIMDDIHSGQDHNYLNSCWGRNGNRNWIGAWFPDSIPPQSTKYNSLADFLNNNPAPKDVRMRLNSNYEAIIGEKTTKVGCQEFDNEVILKLAATIQSNNPT